MAQLVRVVAAAACLGLIGCSGSPSGPTSSSVPSSNIPAHTPGDPTLDSPPRPTGPCVIGFNNLTGHGAPFAAQTVCGGLTVTPSTPNWTASTTYGNPAPFIQFLSPKGTTAVGELVLSAAGVPFEFHSVDVYSSTTPIPYVISGTMGSTSVFVIQATQGNTFGRFAAVLNPQPGMQIDMLRIRLSNAAAPCCTNPMGLDNIRLAF